MLFSPHFVHELMTHSHGTFNNNFLVCTPWIHSPFSILVWTEHPFAIPASLSEMHFHFVFSFLFVPFYFLPNKSFIVLQFTKKKNEKNYIVSLSPIGHDIEIIRKAKFTKMKNDFSLHAFRYFSFFFLYESRTTTINA